MNGLEMLTKTDAYVVSNDDRYKNAHLYDGHVRFGVKADAQVFSTYAKASAARFADDGTEFTYLAVYRVELPHCWLYDTKPGARGRGYFLRTDAVAYGMDEERDRMGLTPPMAGPPLIPLRTEGE